MGTGALKKTVLLVNVKNKDEKIITTHLWFNLTKGFKKLELCPGDLVMFNGRIKLYIKGYKGKRNDVYAPLEMDYLIEYPTQVKLVERKKDISKTNNERK